MDKFKTIELGTTISFSLFPKVQSRIGSDFTGCKLLGVINASLAKFINVDPDAMHAQVYSALPDGTVEDNPYKYDWLHVKLANGTETCVGKPWVLPDSVVVDKPTTFIFYVEPCSAQDVLKIRQQIAAVGKQVVRVESK